MTNFYWAKKAETNKLGLGIVQDTERDGESVRQREPTFSVRVKSCSGCHVLVSQIYWSRGITTMA